VEDLLPHLPAVEEPQLAMVVMLVVV
jgi:hypothetical protein